MANILTLNKKFQILELYFNSPEKRLQVIGDVVGSSPNTISDVVQEFFDNKIEWYGGTDMIFHSKINTENDL
jgi:hypothetical protein